MKRAVLILLLLIVVQRAAAQLRFANPKLDLKTISEDDAPARHTFRYINDSDKPVVITRVETTCGCAQPEYSTAPILPGGRGEVTVTFYPKGHPGALHRSLYVRTSAAQEPIQLVLTGVVTPTTDRYAAYPERIGALRLKQNRMNFGAVRSTGRRMGRIEVVNSGSKPLHLSLMGVPGWLTFRTEPEVIEPDAVGDLIFILDPTGVERGKAECIVLLEGVVAPPLQREIKVSAQID